jgi:hypothetical protein
MALTGTEVLQVLAVQSNGYPAAITEQITTAQLGCVLGSGTFVCDEDTPVTVTDAAITTTAVVIISLNTVGGTVGATPHVASITAGTSFTTAGSTSDTSTYNYRIIA